MESLARSHAASRIARSGDLTVILWIYLPSTSFRSAPVTAASGSGLASLCQRLASSLTWKSKLQCVASWRRALKTAPWTTLLFGRTFERLTAARGVASWISSLRAIRANPSALRASGAARKIRGTCGRRSRASSANASRNGCSSKTLPGISDWAFAKSPKSYNAWVTALQRDCLQRRKSALLTDGKDSLHWPTARAEDAESAGNHPGACDSLTGATRNWKTPATDSFRSRGGKRKNEAGLDQQSRNWPSPRANDHKSGVTGEVAKANARPLCEVVAQWRTPDAPTGAGGSRTRTNSRGKGHQVVLAEQVAQWPTPNANPAPRGKNFTKTDGHYKPHDLMTAVRSSVLGRRTSKRGAPGSIDSPKLNPLFVESLMGLPLGWTAYERLGTGVYRSWWLTHSEAFARLS